MSSGRALEETLAVEVTTKTTMEDFLKNTIPDEFLKGSECTKDLVEEFLRETAARIHEESFGGIP